MASAAIDREPQNVRPDGTRSGPYVAIEETFASWLSHKMQAIVSLLRSSRGTYDLVACRFGRFGGL